MWLSIIFTEDEMVGQAASREEMKNEYKVLKWDHLGDIGIDGRILK